VPITRTLAWVGPDDPTIKPAARPLIRSVREPYEETLAQMASSMWQRLLPGRVWLMPMSHWAYELSHGSREWMPALIENLDLDRASWKTATTLPPSNSAPTSPSPSATWSAAC